jgi:RimJ/RimL family protein N-acetyltransferase
MPGELFPSRVVTDRLVFEPLHESVDLDEFYRICSGRADDGDFTDVTRHVTWSPHEHPKETREFLDTVAERFETGDGGEYAIRPREGEDGAGEIAGVTGIGADWDRRLATFGTWLRRPFWGRGYSGERAAAFLEVAVEHLDLAVVEVSHEPANEQSRRAIEKYVEAHGGRREGRLRNYTAGRDGRITDQVRYTVAREEYRRAATPDVGTRVEF